jgi:hypothetical protein
MARAGPPQRTREDSVALDLLKDKGIGLDRQVFTWRDLVRQPISKLDDDAFTRARVVLMNAVEAEALRFQYAMTRMNREMQGPLARIRRAEQHQRTLVNWLLPADLSPLETTIAHEQLAVELMASAAQAEPDPYLSQVYRFTMLEDFDHLYRYAALLDRIEGKDANNILQSYTDIVPGRPTVVQHRHPEDDLRNPYDRTTVAPITKLNVLSILAVEHQVHDHHMTVGPQFADPMARQVYAEVASIEEQHVTQYESIADAQETWLEKWVLHEATEVYNYYACYLQETNSLVKDIWERFLAYELGHLHFAIEHFRRFDKRDLGAVLPASLPEPSEHKSHRELIREVLRNEVQLRAASTQIVPLEQEPQRSSTYRDQLNSDGSPSQTVAAGYRWTPGTELSRDESYRTYLTQEGHII